MPHIRGRKNLLATSFRSWVDKGIEPRNNPLWLIREGLRVKKALITGITGQDGSYLSELLLGKG